MMVVIYKHIIKYVVIGEIYLSGVGRRSEKCSQMVAMMRLKQTAKGPPSVAQVTHIKTQGGVALLNAYITFC